MNIDFNEQLKHVDIELYCRTKITWERDHLFLPMDRSGPPKENYINFLLEHQKELLHKLGFFVTNLIFHKMRDLYKSNQEQNQDYVDFLVTQASDIESSIKDKELAYNKFLNDACAVYSDDEYLDFLLNFLRDYFDPFRPCDGAVYVFFNYKWYWAHVLKLFIKIQLAQNIIEIKNYIQYGGDKRNIFLYDMIEKGFYDKSR